MKKIIFLLLLLIFSVSHYAETYSVSHKSDKEKNFVFSIIKDSRGKVVARFCLVDPNPFYFFSVDSDSDLFPEIEKNINILAARKKRGQPVAAIFVDFSNQERIRKPFNLKYLVNYLVIISFAQPYLRKVEILSPYKLSYRFFVETKINGKQYFGAMEMSRPFDDNEAKKLINNIKGAGEISLIVPVLDNVPVKLVSFTGLNQVVIYESHENHQGYTCVFLAGDNK